MSNTEITPEALNELVEKHSSPISRDMLIQATAQAIGNASQNTTFAQQHMNTINHVSTAQSIALIQSLGATSAAGL